MKNAQPYLESCLQSAAIQPVRHILIWDDGSTDGSMEMAQIFCKKEPRAKMCEGPHRGVVETRNALAEWGLSLGAEWFNFLDADDRLIRGKIERQFAAIAGEQILWCDTAVLDYGFAPPARSTWLHHDPQDIVTPPLPGTWLLHQTVVKSVKWRPEFESGFNDLAYWLDCVRAGFKRSRTAFVGFLHRRRWSADSVTQRPDRSRAGITKAYPEFQEQPMGTEIRSPLPNPRRLRTTPTSAPYARPSPSPNAERVLIVVPLSTPSPDAAIACILAELRSLRNQDCHITVQSPWPLDPRPFQRLRIPQIAIAVQVAAPTAFDRVIHATPTGG